MSERIKLTEMELSQVIRYGKGYDERKTKLIKQILEDQEKVEQSKQLATALAGANQILASQLDEIKQLKKDEMNKQGMLAREMSMSASLLKQRDDLKDQRDKLIKTVAGMGNVHQKLLRRSEKLDKIKEFADKIKKSELSIRYKTLQECAEAGTDDAWWLLEIYKILEEKDEPNTTT